MTERTPLPLRTLFRAFACAAVLLVLPQGFAALRAAVGGARYVSPERPASDAVVASADVSIRAFTAPVWKKLPATPPLPPGFATPRVFAELSSSVEPVHPRTVPVFLPRRAAPRQESGDPPRV